MLDPDQLVKDFDQNFDLFHELMRHKIREILLVSSPYDAFVLEEDGSLASQIINEYHGLNLSAPPRLTSATCADEALLLLSKRKFDLVLTMPFVGGMDACSFGNAVKQIHPKLPVVLLSSKLCPDSTHEAVSRQDGVDYTYVWNGDASLLLAIVKNIEDHANVWRDTKNAMVRVLILVEDSPDYLSSFLPLLYKVVVRQTQEVLEESLNEEHRILKMRARPKILVASSYEEALKLFRRFRKYVFGVVSDTRFFCKGELAADAGVLFLQYVRDRVPDLPLLLMSSESVNKEKAEGIPAVFVDKNHVDLLREIEGFFLKHLGFGDFIFRLKDGSEVSRVANLHNMERMLGNVSDESLCYHAEHNHFSNWMMARSEVGLANKLSELTIADFADIKQMREYLVRLIHAFRQWRQMGVIASFREQDFDPNVVEFIKIGNGSIGGKARGVAFIAAMLRKRNDLRQKYAATPIRIPRTCVIANDGFADFVHANKLFYLCGGRDTIIARRFLAAALPKWLVKDISLFLEDVKCPLAVRSSSMLEDAQYQPYAGLYKTYMLANNHPQFDVRLKELCDAVKLVYASTYYSEPRSYSRSIGQNRLDSMSVIIQQLIGRDYSGYYYPACSGVAQSHNFYPVSYMKPDEGFVSVVLGFGKAVVEGGKCLRFSPKYPKIQPQFSTVADTLKNSQRYFYALNIEVGRHNVFGEKNLTRLEVTDMPNNSAAVQLCSNYFPEEDRIRDICGKGTKIVTFAQLLKYNKFPLTEIVEEIIAMGKEGMGGDVEIEFAVDLPGSPHKDSFYILQIRPMVAGSERAEVVISDDERQKGFCLSHQSLGNGIYEFYDILVVRPETFATVKTPLIAREIGQLNGKLVNSDKKYLLVGPGRWGSADNLLGIPVGWNDINGVGAIVELCNSQLSVEPSQGTHFFQNITSLGIPYLTVREQDEADYIDWSWLEAIGKLTDGQFMRHIELYAPIKVKIDGKKSEGIIC